MYFRACMYIHIRMHVCIYICMYTHTHTRTLAGAAALKTTVFSGQRVFKSRCIVSASQKSAYSLIEQSVYGVLIEQHLYTVLIEQSLYTMSHKLTQAYTHTHTHTHTRTRTHTHTRTHAHAHTSSRPCTRWRTSLQFLSKVSALVHLAYNKLVYCQSHTNACALCLRHLRQNVFQDLIYTYIHM